MKPSLERDLIGVKISSSLLLAVFRSFKPILFMRSRIQVSYHLRFTFTPRNAPIKEKSELNPNSDLDWHTLSLYPLFQLPGPREQYDKEGGTPGENSPSLSMWLSFCLCFSLSVSPTFSFCLFSVTLMLLNLTSYTFLKLHIS